MLFFSYFKFCLNFFFYFLKLEYAEMFKEGIAICSTVDKESFNVYEIEAEKAKYNFLESFKKNFETEYYNTDLSTVTKNVYIFKTKPLKCLI